MTFCKTPLVGLLTLMTGCASQPTGNTDAARRDHDAKTLFRFDGKSLNGFYTFLKDRGRDRDPDQVFTVSDGMIHISGREWAPDRSSRPRRGIVRTCRHS